MRLSRDSTDESAGDSPTWVVAQRQNGNPASKIVGSEVAHRVSPMLATVRLSNRACGFPAHGFHEDSLFRDAREEIN
jgi:hypothetical protein